MNGISVAMIGLVIIVCFWVSDRFDLARKAELGKWYDTHVIQISDLRTRLGQANNGEHHANTQCEMWMMWALKFLRNPESNESFRFDPNYLRAELAKLIAKSTRATVIEEELRRTQTDLGDWLLWAFKHTSYGTLNSSGQSIREALDRLIVKTSPKSPKYQIIRLQTTAVGVGRALLPSPPVIGARLAGFSVEGCSVFYCWELPEGDE